MGMANHEAMVLMTRLRDCATDFGWKPAEVVALLRGEGNRVIAVVVDPIARPFLTIVAVARGMQSRSGCGRNSQIEGFVGIEVKVLLISSRLRLAGIWPRMLGLWSKGDTRRCGKDASH